MRKTKPSATVTAPRILVIDDAPAVLRAFKMLLEDRVETAPTVSSALAALGRDESLQIIVADLNMPWGGIPFVRSLARRFPERIVIVNSSEASVFTPRVMREIGVFRCLEKGASSLEEIERAIADAEAELSKLSEAA